MHVSNTDKVKNLYFDYCQIKKNATDMNIPHQHQKEQTNGK